MNINSTAVCKRQPIIYTLELIQGHTANILTVLSTAFGSVTFRTVIWLCVLQPKIAIDLKLYSSVSLSVVGTAVGCANHCQITVIQCRESSEDALASSSEPESRR